MSLDRNRSRHSFDELPRSGTNGAACMAQKLTLSQLSSLLFHACDDLHGNMDAYLGDAAKEI